MATFFDQRREALAALARRRAQKGAPAPQQQKRGEHTPEDPVKCPGCGAVSLRREMRENLYVCPRCGCHLKVSAVYRLRNLFDGGAGRELDRNLQPGDPLEFPGYREKLRGLQQSTGMTEAAMTAVGKIGGIPVTAGVLDSRFLMGSMGTAVGEKITRAAEYAQRSRLPLILFCASGGARMQEGILSLMQMAKTAAAMERHHRAGLLSVCVLTNPTTGGVTASFASLGDIILAEPGALIGFAGPRVIRQTIGQELPEGFQRSEFLLDHGFVDHIVDRRELRDTLGLLLRLHQKPGKGVERP